MAGGRHPRYDAQSTVEFERAYREAPKSRRERREERERELRRERQRKRNVLLGTVGRALLGSSKKKMIEKRSREDLLEHESSKRRRERRELRKLRRERQRGKWRGGLAELAVTILVAFVLVFGVVRPFVVAAYKIPSRSMVPTLEVGDRILANKFVYDFFEPERGDIVVFESVDENDDQTLIKRVVGVAGDKIRVRRGSLYVNGELQEEPYLNEHRQTPQDTYGPITVPEGNIFVMGDNRDNSADSRVFGPLPLENVEGEAFMRFWPVPKIGPL